MHSFICCPASNRCDALAKICVNLSEAGADTRMYSPARCSVLRLRAGGGGGWTALVLTAARAHGRESACACVCERERVSKESDRERERGESVCERESCQCKYALFELSGGKNARVRSGDDGGGGGGRSLREGAARRDTAVSDAGARRRVDGEVVPLKSWSCRRDFRDCGRGSWCCWSELITNWSTGTHKRQLGFAENSRRRFISYSNG